MNPARKVAPKRKAKDKKVDKRGSKQNSKSKKRSPSKTTRKGQGAEDSDEDVEDVFVNRRAKKPKTGRIGRTAGKKYPPEIQKALGRAHTLYINGDVVEASTELSRVVVQCSSIPEPYALLALIYQDSGKYEQALLFYKLACARDTRMVGNHREAARIAGILGDHASRLEALKVLVRLQPNNLNVAIERARCLLELQKPRQAFDVYAKAAKRFPRKFDIYLDLAEAVECVSPQQSVFVQQALASCLRRVVGKRYLASDVRDLADGFSARLREIKLENPKPKRLPPRTPGLPSKRESEVAMTATALLVGKLMESRKRQEPQYEVAVQVVEGLGSWLDHCRTMARREDRLYEAEGGDELEDDEDDEEYLDSDSDIRDSNDEASDDDDDEAEIEGDGSSTEDELDGDGSDGEGDEPMDRFELDPGIVVQYGICQLYCGDKEKADNALSLLKAEEPSGPYGEMMMEAAKVYAEMGHLSESKGLLRPVAQSTHIRHRFAGIQLGAAYASQGSHELAAEVYGAVLAERPHHAAALAGVAEAAYWRGKAAVPPALSALTVAVERATKTWEDDRPATPPMEDDEGEDASGFQRLQLLMQWATLSLMEKRTADFACVAIPLVSVALGQLTQRQEFELQQSSSVEPSRSREAQESRPGTAKQGSEASNKQGMPMPEGGGGEGGEGDQGARMRGQSLQWKPTSPVPPILGKFDWQVGLRGEVSALMQRLLQTTDVVAQVGRRAVVWHMVEVVRSLLELGNSAAEVKKLVNAASQPNGFLRRLEKQDLQTVIAHPDTVVLSTMPGGSPIRGPATREGVRLGVTSPAEATAESTGDGASVAITPSENFYPPPWRCVEDNDEDGSIRRAGRPWRPSGRSSHGGGPRRSRSRTLIELDQREDDGDAIYTIVRALSRRPGNDATWNLLQRVVTEREIEPADGSFHREQMDALVSRHRETPHGLLFRGHDATVWNRAKHALKLYSHAHAARPEEPLPILCLAMHICRMVTAMEMLVDNDGACLLQALACLYRYAHLRKSSLVTGEDAGSSGIAIPEVVLEQEIMYNLGRGYHQLGLSELAMEYYNRALQIEDERGDELREWHGGDGVTRETAHNMCALFKRNGQTAMALSILNKYLAVG